MNKWILAATVLMGTAVFVHQIVGGPEVIDVIMVSELPIGIRTVSGVVWHGITTVMIVFTLGLLYLARQRNRPLEVVMAGVQVGFAGLFLYYGFAKLGNITMMPQWIVFLLIPSLTFVGSVQEGK